MKCSRCDQDSVLKSRKEEFCKSCFIRFIGQKQRKAMGSERFKVQYGEKSRLNGEKVLLPFSFGTSSLVLLDLIYSMLSEQSRMHRGKTGFQVLVLIVEETWKTQEQKKTTDLLQSLKQRYDLLEELNIDIRIISAESFISPHSTFEKFCLQRDFSCISEKTEKGEFSIKELLSLCPDRSSKEDFLRLMLEYLFLQVAKSENCFALLPAHCMTKLAEDVISLTVKGRGAVLNELLADDDILFENHVVSIMHPLREVLGSEVANYAFVQDLAPLSRTIAVTGSKITKQMTVGELTRSYFETIEPDYPEVVSTVVKIGSKLTAPNSVVKSNCRLCGKHIFDDPKEWLKKITCNEPAPSVDLSNHKSEICDREGNTDLCFGCIVSLGGTSRDGFLWPVRNPSSKVLSDFIIDDDEV